MKYLKRFESSSDFYTSIDFDTFSPIAKSTSLLIDFKSSDTKEIIKWCDRYNFNIQSSYKYN